MWTQINKCFNLKIISNFSQNLRKSLMISTGKIRSGNLHLLEATSWAYTEIFPRKTVQLSLLTTTKTNKTSWVAKSKTTRIKIRRLCEWTPTKVRVIFTRRWWGCWGFSIIRRTNLVFKTSACFSSKTPVVKKV